MHARLSLMSRASQAKWWFQHVLITQQIENMQPTHWKQGICCVVHDMCVSQDCLNQVSIHTQLVKPIQGT